jgi:hypothetical protein
MDTEYALNCELDIGYALNCELDTGYALNLVCLEFVLAFVVPWY